MEKTKGHINVNFPDAGSLFYNFFVEFHSFPPQVYQVIPTNNPNPSR